MEKASRLIGVDLFSGVGGMSLGFEQAGFDVVAAVDLEQIGGLGQQTGHGGVVHGGSVTEIRDQRLGNREQQVSRPADRRAGAPEGGRRRSGAGGWKGALDRILPVTEQCGVTEGRNLGALQAHHLVVVLR